MKLIHNATLLIAITSATLVSACGSDTDENSDAAAAGTDAGGTAGTGTTAGAGGSSAGTGGTPAAAGTGGTPSTAGTAGADTGGAGAGGSTAGTGGATAGAGGSAAGTAGTGGDAGTGGSAVVEEFEPDPDATVEILSGDLSSCLPGFLEDGGAGAYSGFAGSSDGAYFIWKDAWEGSSLNLRVETWDAFGGATGPGTYTIKAGDTNYADCGVCLFSETAEDGEFWPQAGDTIEFTSLTTGDAGKGEAFSGTFVGTLSNGECSGMVEIKFNAVARDIGYGPL
jgi:hypothetical protein